MLSQLIAENDSLYLNVSNAEESDDSHDLWSLVIKCFIGTLLTFVIFLAIAGNLLVCLAIYNDRRLRKLNNLFIVSLSVADLFVSSLVMPFALANDLTGYWTFGLFCNTWIAFDVMCSTASILNLCAISLDRFIHIKNPLQYNRWITKRVVLSAIGIIWIMSGLISFLPINLGWHEPKKIYTNGTVYTKPVCELDLSPTYATISSFISFYAPCIIMVYLYSRLYVYAKRHAKQIQATTATPAPNIRNGACNKKLLNTTQNHHHAMEHKAAITLGIIVGTFLVCWVPFFCINIVAAVCKSCISDTVFKILSWLGYCNSALNPIIYSIFNTEFREAFRRILLVHLKNFCCGNDLNSTNPMHRKYYKANQRESDTIVAETTLM